MRAATILAIIAPVALAANVSTTIVAPGCTTVVVPTTRPTSGSGSSGSGSGSGAANGANNGTVSGGARPSTGTTQGAPRPSSTIAISNGASQQVISVALMGVVAAGAALVL